MAVPAYELKIHTQALQVLLARARIPVDDPEMVAALSNGIRQWALMVQARAVRNVTGYPVVYDGRVFRVMVRTGTLRGSIEVQYPYQSRFQARVYVNGTHTNPGEHIAGMKDRPVPVSRYALRIERGGDPIDLKKTMMGKTVPFFASRGAKTRGPYTARGLEPVDTAERSFGSKWRSRTFDEKLAAKGKAPMVFTKKGGGPAFKGKRSTSYFIAFRKVGKTGWVIPAAEPRPFMRAAVEQTADQGRLMLIRQIVPVITGGNNL